MREIKFRAWDKKNKEFFVTENLLLRLDGYLFDRENEEELHNVEIQQFIGILDKKGIEIYEGDIMFNQNDKHNYQVMWDDNNSYFMLGKNGGQLSKYVLGEFWEVIGNIYENPELLTN